MYAVEKHRYLVIGSLLGLAALLIADAVLIPRTLLGAPMLGLGGLGAALGGLLGQAVNGAFQVYLARRHAGIRLYRRGARFAVAGLTMAIVAGLIQRAVPASV